MTDLGEPKPNLENQAEQTYSLSTIPPLIRKPKSRSNDALELWASLHSAWLGVILAGGIFGIVGPCVQALVAFSFGGVPIPDTYLIAVLIFILLVGSTLGVVMAAFWSSIAMFTIAFANETFGGLLGQRIAVAVFGGMTGFLGTFWWLLGPQDLGNRLLNIFLVGLAMFIGQIGALTWTSRLGLWSMIRSSDDTENSRVQFQIRHLLVAMIWFSVIFALDQFCPNHELILLVGGYLIFQSFFVWLDHLLVQRLFGNRTRSRKRRELER